MAWNPTAVTRGRAASAGRVRSVGRSTEEPRLGSSWRGAARPDAAIAAALVVGPGARLRRLRRARKAVPPRRRVSPGQDEGSSPGGRAGRAGAHGQAPLLRAPLDAGRRTQDSGRGARLGLAAANDPASTSPAVGPAAPGALVVVRTSIGVARAGAGPPGGAPTPLALRREVRPGARRHFLQLHGRARPGTADPKLESPSGRASGRGAGGRRARGVQGVAGTVGSPVTPRGRRLRRWRWRWHRGAAPGAC